MNNPKLTNYKQIQQLLIKNSKRLNHIEARLVILLKFFFGNDIHRNKNNGKINLELSKT